MGEILEMCMLIAFGCAWPVSIVKSLRVRTAVGTSPVFNIVVMVGYVCGILSKVVGHNVDYVIAFYGLNFVMVGVNLSLYFRNKKLDRQRAAETAETIEAAR